MIHEYNNGIKMHDDCVLRKENIINVHEPVEELILTEIFKTSSAIDFMDVGCSYGYYLFLANMFNYNSIGYEKNKKRREKIIKNIEINNMPKNKFKIYGECRAKNIKEHDSKTCILLMDIQGAEVRLLENSKPENYEHIVIGTHSKGKGVSIDTHNKTKMILVECNYKIKYECEPRKVNFQPDGIVWAVK